MVLKEKSGDCQSIAPNDHAASTHNGDMKKHYYVQPGWLDEP